MSDSLRRPMRTSSLLGEAARNVATGASRALVLAVALSAVMIALARFELAATAGFIQEAERFVSAGGSTFVLTADGLVDGRACARLIDTGLVSGAAAVRSGSPLVVRALPANEIAVYEVTSGFPAVIGTDPFGARQVLLSGDLADTLAPGLGNDRPAAIAVAGGRSVRADGRFPWPDDGRNPMLQYAAVARAPSAGVFDQCWIRSVDPTQDPTAVLRSTLRRPPTSAQDVRISQLNARLGETLNAPEDFARRPTRYAWLVAMLAGLAIAVMAARLRAVELRSAHEVGLPRITVVTQSVLETAAWSVCAALLTFGYATIQATIMSESWRHSLIALGLRVAAGGTSGAIVGTVCGASLALRHSVETHLRQRVG